MKERTEIDQQNLFFTYMELTSCKCYDDARILLNDLVVEELGREYGDKYHFDEETDEWICDEVKYKNSANPKVVKLAVIDEMTSFFNRHEQDTTIIPSKRMDDDIRKVRDWLGRWEKEAAPKLKVKEYRLIPKNSSVKNRANQVFDFLLEDNLVYEDGREMWNYICGITDNEEAEPIIWRGDWPKLCAIIELFLVSYFYFKYDKGIKEHFLCQNKFISEDKGTVLDEKKLKSTKNRCINNGTLAIAVTDFRDRFKLNINEKLSKELNRSF